MLGCLNRIIFKAHALVFNDRVDLIHVIVQIAIVNFRRLILLLLFNSLSTCPRILIFLYIEALHARGSFVIINQIIHLTLNLHVNFFNRDVAPILLRWPWLIIGDILPSTLILLLHLTTSILHPRWRLLTVVHHIFLALPDRVHP